MQPYGRPQDCQRVCLLGAALSLQHDRTPDAHTPQASVEAQQPYEKS
jgi:hypothetical protein